MHCSRTRCRGYWTTLGSLLKRFAAIATALGVAPAFAALTLAFAGVRAQPAQAAIETDPVALYASMKKAFDKGTNELWPFADELFYFSSVLDAGRAYALFRPTDPQYVELVGLTVQLATQLHYDELLNNDAAGWYVREAATYVAAHGDEQHVADAKTILARLDSDESDISQAARDATVDALANAKAYPHDADALVEVLVAEARAFNITHDTAFRSNLLAHAALPQTPLVRVPDPEYGELFQFANAAASGNDLTYTEDDVAAAKQIVERRKNTPDLQVIGSVRAIPHELRLTRTAPADEYFGNLKMSPLGVHNELVRINKYLDVGWGTKMSTEAVNVADSIEDWQRQYPHDLTLPRNLLELYKLLMRIDSDDAHNAATKVKYVLLVQYPDSGQARELSADPS